MSGWAAFCILLTCLLGLAWLTGPEWCPGSSFADAPICAGVEQ
jgi:hypothetical protein